MKSTSLPAVAALVVIATLASQGVLARDTTHRLSFAELLASPEAKEKLDPAMHFYLAGQATPAVTNRSAEIVTNRKTNGFGKADLKACRWAALAALIVFQDRAREAGSNAIVDIVSYYKQKVFSSPTEYECHAGGIVVGVALKGVIAKVAP
jgi:hypothetical protein